MFTFTTQNVYNYISTSGADQNLIIGSGTTPALRIGNTRFDASVIESITVVRPQVEQLAKVTFDMEDIIPSEGNISARIVFYIGLSMNCQDSFYANDFIYKGKPLYIEFPVKSTDTADVVAKRVKKIADKYLLFVMGTDKILNVTATTDSTSGSETGTVTFEAVNGYQIIKKATLQKFDPTAKQLDCCTNQGEYVDVITGVPVVYVISSDVVKTETSGGDSYFLDEDGVLTKLGDDQVAIFPGLEAFNDYNWMLHNLRLPTLANTNIWAPTKEEMPIPGQCYTQFIIRIKKDRDGIAGEVVGHRATSVTTHVMYVAGDCGSSTGNASGNAAEKFLNALRTTFSSIDVNADMGANKNTGVSKAETTRNNPYADLLSDASISLTA